MTICRRTVGSMAVIAQQNEQEGEIACVCVCVCACVCKGGGGVCAIGWVRLTAATSRESGWRGRRGR